MTAAPTPTPTVIRALRIFNSMCPAPGSGARPGNCWSVRGGDGGAGAPTVPVPTGWRSAGGPAGVDVGQRGVEVLLVRDPRRHLLPEGAGTDLAGHQVRAVE